jgi:hypothetical protein
MKYPTVEKVLASEKWGPKTQKYIKLGNKKLAFDIHEAIDGEQRTVSPGKKLGTVLMPLRKLNDKDSKDYIEALLKKEKLIPETAFFNGEGDGDWIYNMFLGVTGMEPSGDDLPAGIFFSVSEKDEPTYREWYDLLLELPEE